MDSGLVFLISEKDYITALHSYIIWHYPNPDPSTPVTIEIDPPLTTGKCTIISHPMCNWCGL